MIIRARHGHGVCMVVTMPARTGKLAFEIHSRDIARD